MKKTIQKSSGIVKRTERMDNNISSWISQVNNIAEIYHDEFIELLKQYRKTNNIDIRNKLIESHLRICVKPAMYYSECSGSYTNFFDFISECTISLVKALDDYDLRRGVYFAQFVRQRLWRSCYWYYKRKIFSNTIQIDSIKEPSYISKCVSEKLENIESIMNNLSEKERKVFKSKYISGETWIRIGRKHHISERTINKIRANILNSLRCQNVT